MSRINNTQVDYAHDIDVVMPMYNLIEQSDNYSKTPGIFWQYYRDEPAINVASDNIVDFNEAKEQIADQTGNNCTKNVEKWNH